MRRFIPHYQTFGPATNFGLLLFILVVSYIAVWLWYAKPIIAALVVAFPGILFVLYARSYKLLYIMFIAALFGTLHEVYFISKGYWFYQYPSFWGVPLYLPAVWANIGILAVAIYKGILQIDAHSFLTHTLPSFGKAMVGTHLGLIFSLVAIFFFAPQPLSLMLAFLFIDILYLYWMGSLPLALVGILSMFAGSIADLVAVPLGIWGYPPSTASWLGVPVYIFIGWDIVGILLAGLYASLDLFSPSQENYRHR